MILDALHLQRITIDLYSQLTKPYKKENARGIPYKVYIINIKITKEQYEYLYNKWYSKKKKISSILFNENNLVNNSSIYYLTCRQFRAPNIEALNNILDKDNLPLLDLDITLNENNGFLFFEIQKVYISSIQE